VNNRGKAHGTEIVPGLLLALRWASRDTFNLGCKVNPQRVVDAFVAANYFTTMMIRPTIGRVFLTGEDRAGHNHVAVISAGLWHTERVVATVSVFSDRGPLATRKAHAQPKYV
jgi:hypothetical protein